MIPLMVYLEHGKEEPEVGCEVMLKNLAKRRCINVYQRGQLLEFRNTSFRATSQGFYKFIALNILARG